MTKYNFDRVIPREGTDSVKWDLRKDFFGKRDVLPLWVADMDFRVPDFVTDAIIERANHPVYGYSFLSEGYYRSIIEWWKTRHGYHMDKDWITFSPGVVTALNLIVQTFSKPGDAIIVQPPVYFPFFQVVERNGRKLLYNQLALKNGRYTIDLEDLGNKMRQGAEMIILCSPHNPVGRVWKKKELEELVALCLENNVKIVSDEIHADLVFRPNKHIPTATLGTEVADNTITCLAPSKTFNLAGLSTSSVVISNEELRERFRNTCEKLHFNSNLFGAVASEAAYTHGADWLNQLLAYLECNVEYLVKIIEDRLPGIQMTRPEATYLAWLDFRKLISKNTGKINSASDLKKYLIEKLSLGFNDGRTFGPGGRGFQRLNFGCPRSSLEKVMEDLQQII